MEFEVEYPELIVRKISLKDKGVGFHFFGKTNGPDGLY